MFFCGALWRRINSFGDELSKTNVVVAFKVSERVRKESLIDKCLMGSISIKCHILTSRAVRDNAVERRRGRRRKSQRVETQTVAEKVADVLDNQIDGNYNERLEKNR